MRCRLRARPAVFDVFLMSAMSLSACQTDRARPLPLSEPMPSLVTAAPTLQSRAAALHNPLLRPIDIDVSDGFSPDELAQAAVILNPALVATRQRNTVATAQARSSGILPNPTLSFGLDVPVGDHTAGEVPGFGLNLGWEITSLLTHSAKVAAATQIAEQGQLDTAWQEWQVAEAARQSAYDVLIVRRQLAAARQLSSELDRIAGAARKSAERHDLTATDVAAAEAASGESKISVAAAERDLADTEFALRRAVGVAPEESIPLDERTLLPDHLDVPDSATLARRVAAQRIDLVALQRGYDAQEASVRAAILGQFPKINLGIAHTRDYGDFLTLGPALTIDLPIFDRNQGVIATEQATRQQLYDEYVSRLFEARSDICRAVAAVRAIDEQLRVIADQIRSLKKLVASDEAALKAGNVDVATYYVAAVGLAQRQSDQTKLQQDLIHAFITLELAAGIQLPLTE